MILNILNINKILQSMQNISSTNAHTICYNYNTVLNNNNPLLKQSIEPNYLEALVNFKW